MAIAISSESKRQKYLIFILILVVFGALIFFLRPKVKGPEEIIIKKPSLIEIDFQVLENPILKELQPFEEIPPLEKIEIEIGRENPFTPY